MLQAMPSFLRLIFYTFFFLFAFETGAAAATIRELSGSGFNWSHFNRLLVLPRDEPTCDLLLEGEIFPGDADRIIERIEQIQEEKRSIIANHDYIGSVLCLNSPGGSLLDALRVASAIRVATRVRAGDECLSACAMIFMSGHVNFDESVPMAWRVLEPGGLLGFHAPSLGESLGSLSGEEINSLYNLSLATISEIASTLMVRFAGEIDRYFPPSLLAATLTTPPDDMMFIDTVDEAARWNISVSTNWNSASILAMDLIDIARSCEASLRWQAAESAMSLAYRPARSFNGWHVDGNKITYVYNSYEGPIPSPWCTFDLPADHELPGGWIDASSADEAILNEQVFVMLGDLEGDDHRRFALFSPNTALTELPNYVDLASESPNILEDEPLQVCGVHSGTSVIGNVVNFTNLRERPGISSRVVAQIPYGAVVGMTSPGSYFATNDCIDACSMNDARRISECIAANGIWVAVTYQGNSGFLSRKFLFAQ
jgi:hypothetical protein